MRLISTKEAAEILGISRRAVQKKAAKGQLPVVEYRIVRGKRAPFFDEEQIKRIAFNNGELDCEPTTNLTANCEPITANLTANCEPTNDTPKIKENTDRDNKETQNDIKDTDDEPIAARLAYGNDSENCRWRQDNENCEFGSKTCGNEDKTKEKARYDRKIAISDVWIDSETASRLLGITDRAVRYGCDDGKYRCKKITGDKGGVKYTIALSSLGDKVLRQYWAEYIKEKIEIGEFPVISNQTKPTKQEKLAILNFYENLKGQVRIDIIVELINGEYKQLRLTKARLLRWQRAYKTGGIDALSDKRGGKAAICDYETLREVLIAHPAAITDKNLYELYKLRYIQKHGIYDNIKYTAFIKAKKKLLNQDKAVQILHNKGLDSLYSNIATTKKKKPLFANAEWQIDATPLDFMVLSPVLITKEDKRFDEAIPYSDWYEYRYKKELDWGIWSDEYRVMYEPKRKQVIAIVDVATGMRVWGMYDSSSSLSDLRLLKKALMKLGKPVVIKTDNGSDYLSEQFTNALLGLGILQKVAKPYKGKDKGNIERNFRTVLHSRLELLPGYIGHNVVERQLIEKYELLKSERLSGVKTNIKDLLTEEEMEIVIDKFIDDMAHEYGWLEKYEQYKDNIEYIDEETINIAIGKRYKRKVSRTGIMLNGCTYTHPDLWKLQDREVDVVENIDDISKVYVLKNGMVFCEAVDENVRGFSLDEYRRIEKAHTKVYKDLRRAAKKIREQDRILINEAFISDALESERERKEELLKKTKDRKMKKVAGIDENLLKAVERFEKNGGLENL